MSVRLKPFDENPPFANFRDLSLGNIGRLAPTDWDFGLGYFAWELPFKMVRFESFDWDLWLGIFRLGTFAYYCKITF